MFLIRRTLGTEPKGKEVNMSWTHIEDKQTRARKNHRCYLCGKAIEKGSTYLSRTGVNEDGFITARFHPSCEEYTRDWDEMDWETFTPGDLAQWLK